MGGHDTLTSTRDDALQLQELPLVLLVNVLSYLETRDVVRAASAHRLVHAVVMRDAFWQRMYAQRWRASDEKQGWARVCAFAAKYVGTGDSATPLVALAGSSRASGDAAVDWNALYRERHIVERNWASGRAVITTLNGHNGTVTCLQFSDTQLVRSETSGRRQRHQSLVVRCRD